MTLFSNVFCCFPKRVSCFSLFDYLYGFISRTKPLLNLDQHLIEMEQVTKALKYQGKSILIYDSKSDLYLSKAIAFVQFKTLVIL